ncbi:patatin-like phospholipase [Ophiostoma piceae UAMH 11346]|uniref:Patatin-like phospholipase n=1 Tax=Ophiostoma piceae (strain UAMH 11346) TaxID=1262450 RepID=S3CT22_OPHP1|nr:patatin-like phospholipase [Ophiostoma piceae UAMH 11346]
MDLILPREGRDVRDVRDDTSKQQPQQPPPQQSPNVARRLSSMAAGLSESIRSRVADTMAERRRQQLRTEKQHILEGRMANAQAYEEWDAAARMLDDLEDHNAWKASTEADDFYNPDLIASRLKDLEAARRTSREIDADLNADPAASAHNIRRMMHLVRTALSRDVGGISNAKLYCDDQQLLNNSDAPHIGTKYLVERYARASVDLIQELLDRTRSVHSLPPGLTHRDMLDQLLLARRSYGRSALILSGGAVYGMAHIGVLKALFDRQLLPRIISGTSAGSIVASLICSRTDDEVPGLLAEFAHGDLAVFTDKDNPDSWMTHIGRALRYGAWHDSRHLARVMRDLLGDMTFQEAFNRTRRILNITVSSKPGLRLPGLLNYLTAPDVIIWSAVVASCSIPGVFDARPLLVRDAETGEHVPWDPAEQLWIDGSLDSDVPVERLGSMLNVNHFIVSQTNPHIVLLVDKSDAQKDTDKKTLGEVMYTLGWLGKSEAIYALETLVDAGIFRGGASMLLQMLTQRYTADINILPRMSLAKWGTALIKNPTPDFMMEACRVGEQATWPCISRIAQACAVELALDRAVHTLRERIAFSDSQVNLRRFFTGSYELGVRRNHSAISAKTKKSASPTLARSRSPALIRTGLPTITRSGSPTAYRLPPTVPPPHIRPGRRGSGGSLQLSARRQHTRYALDTILSEEGSGRDLSHDSDEESEDYENENENENDSEIEVVTESLAARRGMGNMSLQFKQTPLVRSKSYGHNVFGGQQAQPASYTASHNYASPSYRRSMKQNSLQQLPISAQTQTPQQTPRQTPRVTPRQTPLATPKVAAKLAPPMFWKQSGNVASFIAYDDDSSFCNEDDDDTSTELPGDAQNTQNIQSTQNAPSADFRRSRSVSVIVQQSRTTLVQPKDADSPETATNEQLSDEEDETDGDETDDDDVFMTSRLR